MRTEIICVLNDDRSYKAMVDEENRIIQDRAFLKEFSNITEGVEPGDMFLFISATEPGTLSARVEKIPYKENLRRWFEQK